MTLQLLIRVLIAGLIVEFVVTPLAEAVARELA